jgi:DNA polymerase III delta prime subunit
MHTAVFVVGPPGVGKTSAMRVLLGEDYRRFTLEENGRVKWTFSEPYAFAGHYGLGTFDGADTVPNDGWEPNLDYWQAEILPNKNFQFTVFDGDRFSHANAQKRLEDAGARVLCVHLTASDEAMKARREERGSNQNETWLKGRVSKAKAFAERFKPKETEALFDDMFGGGADDSETENRLLEVVVEDITPEQVADKVKTFLGC